MRLLCAQAGIALGADEDPYEGLGPPRNEIKLAINVMLNASSWSSARGALIEKLSGRYGPSAGTQADLLRTSVEQRFPGLVRDWNTGHGLRLQNIDAEICAVIQGQADYASTPPVSPPLIPR